MIQVGRELVEGLEAHSAATARSTGLPGTTRETSPQGVLLSVPLRGLQQALGVLVFFCSGRPTSARRRCSHVSISPVYIWGSICRPQDCRNVSKPCQSLRKHLVLGVLNYDPDRIIGHSLCMRAIMQEIAQAAPSRSTVLLRGESGTGKELVARALHRLSDRGQQPFVKLNCAALPESLLESELFGHERGAFTGAVKTRRGRFELADHGTLFLDEIGDISLATQIKLLRVLQERTFERVGGSRSLTVDVRIIAATNADLEEAVRTRHFREDLYYRLNVVPIVLPPLRERKEDIPLLVGHFLQRFNAENHKALKISSPAMDLIVGYEWPGNVATENCIERMVVMARREISARGRPLPITIHMPTAPPRVLFPESTAHPPCQGGGRHRTRTPPRSSCVVAVACKPAPATLLGITPRQLGYKLKKYHITPKMVLG